jgi:hypothetical protein
MPMKRHTVRYSCLALAALASLVVLNQSALAGPPLICHAIEIGNARSLPWGGGAGWRSVKHDYDIHRLVGDTMALLGPETPAIVRMETLRRATVYSIWSARDYKVGYANKDFSVATDLLARLRARAEDSRIKGRARALALFDYGYLVESYKQSLPGDSELIRGLDGYASVTKAIEMSGGEPEMEFAAALIMIDPRRGSRPEHLQRAAAGAADGSLLAQNLILRFGDRGKSIAELRSNLGTPRN